MIVVVEGMDASGKTRLARLISNQCSLDYVDRDKLGCGPPSSHEEVVDRLERYLQLDNCIFDRHTAISQPIYGILREDPPLPEALIDEFYSRNPVIIYARCIDDGLGKHILGNHDTPEHLKAIEENYNTLVSLYDNWAARHATIFYRQYGESKLIANMIQGAFRR